ncbi:MAG: ABC transporter permease [Bdellovibrionales bacterium]|nr:ABC transporter permease [Bdellovibrionales bacterium]
MSHKLHLAQSHNLEALWGEAGRLPRLTTSGTVSQLVTESLRTIMASPFTAIVTTLTVTLSLFLLSTFILLVEVTSGMLSSSQQEVRLSIYFRDTATQASIDALRSTLSQDERLAEITFVSKDEALSQFRTELGEQQYMLDGLEGQNPLPSSLEVTAKTPDLAADVFSGIESSLRTNPDVELVQYSQGLLEKLGRIVGFLRLVGFLAISLILLLTGAIISNTIRLAVYARRTEIEIMHLVGATDWYVRTPFMIVLKGLSRGLSAECSV